MPLHVVLADERLLAVVAEKLTIVQMVLHVRTAILPALEDLATHRSIVLVEEAVELADVQIWLTDVGLDLLRRHARVDDRAVDFGAKAVEYGCVR